MDSQLRRRVASSTLGVLACSGVWAFSVLSPGYPPGAVEVYASRAWLTSSRIGQIALVDGSTTDVAAQLDLHRPGRDLVVAQSGADAILADSTDGAVLRVDGATLGVSPPVFPFGHDATSLSLSVGGGTAYAVDNRRGIVVGLDPTTLAVRADPVPVAARISSDASMVDRDGRLWSVDDATGDVVSVHSGDKTVATRAGTAGKVALLAANGRPVAVDLAQHTVSRFDAKSGQLEGTQPIELRADDAVSVGASPGADEVFAAVTNRGVLIICDLESGANRVVQLPPGLSRLGRPVEAHGRVFLPDLGTGLVHIVDTTSRRFVTSVTVPGGPAGHLQLIPREDRVFYNDPDSERAGAILMDGTLTAASKYNPANPSEGLTPATADVTPVNVAPVAQPSPRTTETPPPPDSSAATSTEATAPSVPRQGSAGNDPSAGGTGSGGQGGASAGGTGTGDQGGQSGQGAISPSPAATPTDTPTMTPTDTTRPPSLEGTITLTSRAPVVGQTVNLQMLINGVPAATAVSWSFGDGTSVSKNPVEHTWHANSGAGVYLVTATTQVNGSTVRATAEVSVKDSPDTTAPVIGRPNDRAESNRARRPINW